MEQSPEIEQHGWSLAGVEPIYNEKTQEEVTKRYKGIVDDVLNLRDSSKDATLLGYTPKEYQTMGFPALPVSIGRGHIYSIAKTEAEARSDGQYKPGQHYHGLGENTVKSLYESLQHPYAVIASKDIDTGHFPVRSLRSVVAIVDIGQGKTKRLVPFELTVERTVDGTSLDVNMLSSVYDKDVSNLIAESLAQEKSGDIGVFYVSKKAMAEGAYKALLPEQPPKGIAYGYIMHDISEKVNLKFQNQTQTKQFLSWFGDWQNDPERASKIVNEDGTPKVVYHGTDAEFDAFDVTKGRSTMDIQGAFFSPWDIDAGDYGENVGAYYLSIKNPAPEGVAYKALNMFKGQNNAGIKAREYLIQKGYDGVNNSDEEYIAFYPEQIKSATDNIGLFDKENPKYNYSLTAPTGLTRAQRQQMYKWRNEGIEHLHAISCVSEFFRAHASARPATAKVNGGCCKRNGPGSSYIR